VVSRDIFFLAFRKVPEFHFPKSVDTLLQDSYQFLKMSLLDDWAKSEAGGRMLTEILGNLVAFLAALSTASFPFVTCGEGVEEEENSLYLRVRFSKALRDDRVCQDQKVAEGRIYGIMIVNMKEEPLVLR